MASVIQLRYDASDGMYASGASKLGFQELMAFVKAHIGEGPMLIEKGGCENLIHGIDGGRVVCTSTVIGNGVLQTLVCTEHGCDYAYTPLDGTPVQSVPTQERTPPLTARFSGNGKARMFVIPNACGTRPAIAQLTTADGLVVTDASLVLGAKEIAVTFKDAPLNGAGYVLSAMF